MKQKRVCKAFTVVLQTLFIPATVSRPCDVVKFGLTIMLTYLP